jgi:hypothetical protein
MVEAGQTNDSRTADLPGIRTAPRRPIERAGARAGARKAPGGTPRPRNTHTRRRSAWSASSGMSRGTERIRAALQQARDRTHPLQADGSGAAPSTPARRYRSSVAPNPGPPRGCRPGTGSSRTACRLPIAGPDAHGFAHSPTSELRTVRESAPRFRNRGRSRGPPDRGTVQLNAGPIVLRSWGRRYNGSPPCLTSPNRSRTAPRLT